MPPYRAICFSDESEIPIVVYPSKQIMLNISNQNLMQITMNKILKMFKLIIFKVILKNIQVI